MSVFERCAIARLEQGQGIFDFAQGFALGIVPLAVVKQRANDELRAGEAPVATGKQRLVLGQAPASVPWRAKDMGFVPRENGVKPEGRGQGVDRSCVL